MDTVRKKPGFGIFTGFVRNRIRPESRNTDPDLVWIRLFSYPD